MPLVHCQVALGSRVTRSLVGFGFLVKVVEDLLNQRWIVNAGDGPDCPTARLAGLNVDIEYAL